MLALSAYEDALMGMMYELGVKFGIQGTDQADRWFSQMKSGISGMTGHIGSNVPQAERHLERLAHSSEKMAQRFQRAFGMAKAAAGAFVAGKALSGVASWLGGGDAEAGAIMDKLRRAGTSDKEFAEYRKHRQEIGKKHPGVTEEGYLETIFDVQGKFSADDVMRNKRATEANLLLSKALGHNVSMKDSSDLLRKYVGGFGAGKSKDELLELIERFPGMISIAMKDTGARGHDIAMGLPHVAGILGAAGKDPAEALAPLSILAETSGERAGEIFRNVYSKEGVGYGKLAAQLFKAKRLGGRSEAELGEEESKTLKEDVKKTEQWFSTKGARLMAQGEDVLLGSTHNLITQAQELSKKGWLDFGHAMSESYSETSQQGLPILTAAAKSGRLGELREKMKSKSPQEFQQEAEASYQSPQSKQQIFEQRVSYAFSGMKRIGNAIISDQYEEYGSLFDKIAKKWEDNSEQILSNLRSFVGGVKAGLFEAFSGIPGATQWAEKLVDKLAEGNPETWKEMGKNLGAFAGTSLKEVVSDLNAIGSALTTIASGIKALQKAGSWYEDSALPWLVDKFTSARGGSGLARPKGETAYTPLSLLEKGAEGLVDGSAYSALENFAGGAKSLAQRIMPSWRQPEAVAQAAPDQPAPEVTVNPSVSVELDGDEIAAKVTQRVEQNLRDDRDRRGGTAGGSFRGGR